MSKKKLDELFQDKLLGIKEVPDDRVWASIEASLDKKKKKRILPLWWSLGGIAAALLVGLLIFNPLDTETDTKQIVTDVEHKSSDTIENPNDASKLLDLDKNDKNSHEVASEDESTLVSKKPEVQVATTEISKDEFSNETQKTNKKIRLPVATGPRKMKPLFKLHKAIKIRVESIRTSTRLT